ncbi:MAG: LicD family protein [Lachnospiraceae bacterium]|nr:LicD family protein [Lachnospiraceae bacterium]
MTDPAFLKDEVRCGFMIPTAIKQAWAGSLRVLAEIDRICVKHGINYYAEWGTLLGAVRHGGFVPWDDDLDIGMMRPDYRRFREAADKELPEGFMVQDYASLEDYRQFVVRVTNSERMNFGEEHLNEFNNFPFIASIDIFVSDYLYPDEEKEKERDREILRLIALADSVRDGEIAEEAAKREMRETERRYGVRLPELRKKRDVAVALYALAEEQMGRVGRDEASMAGQIFPWIIKGGTGVSREVFEEYVRLPFEDTTMPVQAQYARMLKKKYNDFMKVSKIWGGHGYPFFEAQRESFEASAGMKMPAFKYEPGMEKKEREDSLKDIAAECIAQLKALADAYDPATYYAASQQIAIELGTLAEQVYGEASAFCRVLVPVLEQFCEKLYTAAESGEKVDISEVETAACAAFGGREEVLFVVYDAASFEDIRELYEEERAKADTAVVRLPVWKKDALGVADRSVDAGDDPEGVVLTAYDAYDPGLRRPARIYIRWPYDNANPVLTVPAAYFASRLKNCTDELICVMPRGIRDFGADEKNDVYNMKHYVCVPGPVCADSVIVWSEVLKERVAEALGAFTGKDMKEKIKLFRTGAVE